MDLSILIISYNTRELTLACLRSVFEQTRSVRFEVIVVDNESSDGSADAIAREFPQVRLIRPGKNLGFAGANNLAAEYAAGRYILLLNPDTVILDGAIDKVVAFADQHPDSGITGGRTFFADMQLNEASCHGRPTPWSLLCMGLGLSSALRRSALFNPESLGAWDRDSVRDVDAVSGCFLLIRSPLWRQLEGFDLDFFMYGEDTDLCLRAWKVGTKCTTCPDARLIHYGGQSERVRADKMIRLFRAKVQLFEKHWHPRSVWFGVTMLRTWALTRMLGIGMVSKVRTNRRSSYEAWRDVWRRRAEYGRTGTVPSGPAATTQAGKPSLSSSLGDTARTHC